MTSGLLEIIGVACFAALFTVLSNLVQTAEWYFKIKIPKPFNCELCMGWWLGLIYFWYTKQPIENIIIFASASSVASMFIVKLSYRC